MSTKNIILHRISYKADVSWPLLNAGYLSIGWSDFVNDETDRYVRERDFPSFQKFVLANATGKNRNCLLRFVQLKKGDWVVVPHPYMFSVYKVEENACTVRGLPKLSICSTGTDNIKPGTSVIKNERGLLVYDVPNKELIDLGFVVKVKPVCTNISRSQYADAALTARLKIRLTNVLTNNLRTNIEHAIKAAKQNKPINIYESVIANTADVVLKTLRQTLTPEKFEKLVLWYFKRIGATDVYIPPKNPSEKEGYEDADVVATFEHLKTIVYVQVKKHEGTTGTWGVEQIKGYSDVHGKQDDYTVCKWAISSADFSEDTILKAVEADVHLIDGKQFSIMLLNAGIGNLEKAVL